MHPTSAGCLDNFFVTRAATCSAYNVRRCRAHDDMSSAEGGAGRMLLRWGRVERWQRNGRQGRGRVVVYTRGREEVGHCVRVCTQTLADEIAARFARHRGFVDTKIDHRGSGSSRIPGPPAPYVTRRPSLVSAQWAYCSHAKPLTRARTPA